jgi:DNA-binding CsgD family transcriptional regulator
MPETEIRRKPCIAVIADMVKSRDIPSSERAKLQERFTNLIEDLNKKYHRLLLSRFVITLGDEFQGLLLSASPLPDILWDLESDFSDRELRVGVGFGVLHTPAHRYAMNVDGPVLHNARAAITKAREKSALGGVFFGFGEVLDPILNGLARILWFHRSRFTAQQRKTIELLRQGLSQSEIAERLKVSRQAISKQVSSAGWSAYVEAENAWRSVMKEYVDPAIEGVKGAGFHR